MLLWNFAGLIVLANLAISLNPESAKEGECLPYKLAKNLDQDWFASANLPYISAGNKYNLYGFASTHPQFLDMREFEFYYQACFQQYQNLTSGTGIVYGFGGGIIGNYYLKPSAEEKGVINVTPLPGMEDTVKATVTLTDNKNFVFFSTCMMGTNQRGWNVMSLTPSLNEKTRQLIEDHAMSMGFSKDQMVFLRYESCSASSPVPGSYSSKARETAVNGKTSQAMLFEQKMKRRGR